MKHILTQLCVSSSADKSACWRQARLLFGWCRRVRLLFLCRCRYHRATYYSKLSTSGAPYGTWYCHQLLLQHNRHQLPQVRPPCPMGLWQAYRWPRLIHRLSRLIFTWIFLSTTIHRFLVILYVLVSLMLSWLDLYCMGFLKKDRNSDQLGFFVLRGFVRAFFRWSSFISYDACLGNSGPINNSPQSTARINKHHKFVTFFSELHQCRYLFLAPQSDSWLKIVNLPIKIRKLFLYHQIN